MKFDEHCQAIELRKRGYSMKEIARELSVAKSSASLWVRNVVLDAKAEARLLTRVTAGQLASAKTKRDIVAEREARYYEEALPLGIGVTENKNYAKLLCAMLYWCEGAKASAGGVCFVNSDPKVIAKFLELLRGSFKIQEERFKPCIHLHSYHSPQKQLAFWSKVTNIPPSKFSKPFLKKNTGIRIREGYQGCIAIRYYNSDLARRLNAIAKAFLSQ